MSYKITRHSVPSTGDAHCADVEPPEEDYVPVAFASPRPSHVVVLWRPQATARVEVEGESVGDLESLRDCFPGATRVEKGE